MAKSAAKNELTEEQFASFLSWLSPSPEFAGEAYERLRFRLITFFAHRNCRFPDELADLTINRVAGKIGELEIENKPAFCYGVAKNIFLESLRKERDFVNVDEIQIAQPKVEEPFDDSCLEKCLSELSVENRELVIGYFSESKTAKIKLRDRLADDLGVTKTNLRMKILRIKQVLKSCLIDCSE